MPVKLFNTSHCLSNTGGHPTHTYHPYLVLGLAVPSCDEHLGKALGVCTDAHGVCEGGRGRDGGTLGQVGRIAQTGVCVITLT